jgi:predicted nucleic acid-binding protein
LPGRASSGPAWGELPLVVDTSAWSRAHHADVRARWIEALLADRIRISPMVRIEILHSARDGNRFDEIAEKLSALRTTALTGAVARAAEAGMRALAHRSAGAQRLPVVDYLVAATAQETGAAVLHYDRHYDTLAEIMEFESVWLAPAGSLA